jgi:hypothetical protein
MCTAEDIRDDARMEANHADHAERGENHWYTCPLCDDESDDDPRRQPGFPRSSTDKTHGKMGHFCSTLCGAAMLREITESEQRVLDGNR